MKFTSFRHRTKAYRQKKNLDDGVTAHVDLTKKRLSLLRKANYLVRNRDEVLYCYVDINCQLKLKRADTSKQDKLFSSLDKLNEILGEINSLIRFKTSNKNQSLSSAKCFRNFMIKFKFLILF